MLASMQTFFLCHNIPDFIEEIDKETKTTLNRIKILDSQMKFFILKTSRRNWNEFGELNYYLT